MIIHRFLQIPVRLCQFTIRNKFFSPFYVYLALKSRCSGQIILTKSKIQEIGKDLSLSPRAVQNNIKLLQARNWIGHNPATKYYFIRGFNIIMDIENLKGKKSICYSVLKDGNCKEQFRAFIAGVSIGYLANVQKWKERCHKESEYYIGNSNHNSIGHLPSHYEISCEALKKIYGISISTASVYKSLAHKYGYLEVQKNFKESEFKLQTGGKQKAGPEGYQIFLKENYPKHANKLRIINGVVYEQLPDLIKVTSLEFTNRRYHTSSNNIKKNKM